MRPLARPARSLRPRPVLFSTLSRSSPMLADPAIAWCSSSALAETPRPLHELRYRAQVQLLQHAQRLVRPAHHHGHRQLVRVEATKVRHATPNLAPRVERGQPTDYRVRQSYEKIRGPACNCLRCATHTKMRAATGTARRGKGGSRLLAGSGSASRTPRGCWRAPTPAQRLPAPAPAPRCRPSWPPAPPPRRSCQPSCS